MVHPEYDDNDNDRNTKSGDGDTNNSSSNGNNSSLTPVAAAAAAAAAAVAYYPYSNFWPTQQQQLCCDVMAPFEDLYSSYYPSPGSRLDESTTEIQGDRARGRIATKESSTSPGGGDNNSNNHNNENEKERKEEDPVAAEFVPPATSSPSAVPSPVHVTATTPPEEQSYQKQRHHFFPYEPSSSPPPYYYYGGGDYHHHQSNYRRRSGQQYNNNNSATPYSYQQQYYYNNHRPSRGGPYPQQPQPPQQQHQQHQQKYEPAYHKTNAEEGYEMTVAMEEESVTATMATTGDAASTGDNSSVVTAVHRNHHDAEEELSACKDEDNTTPLRSNGMRRQRQQQHLLELEQQQQQEEQHENNSNCNMMDVVVEEGEEDENGKVAVDEEGNKGQGQDDASVKKSSMKKKNGKKTDGILKSSSNTSSKYNKKNSDGKNDDEKKSGRVQPSPTSASRTSPVDDRGYYNYNSYGYAPAVRGEDGREGSPYPSYDPYSYPSYPSASYYDQYHQAHQQNRHHRYYYHYNSPNGSFDQSQDPNGEEEYDYGNRDEKKKPYGYPHATWRQQYPMEVYDRYYKEQRRRQYYDNRYKHPAQDGSQQSPHPYELAGDDSSVGVPPPPAPQNGKAPYWYQHDNRSAFADGGTVEDDGSQSKYGWDSSVYATPDPKVTAGATTTTNQVTPETPHNVRFRLPNDNHQGTVGEDETTGSSVHRQDVSTPYRPSNLGPGFDSAMDQFGGAMNPASNEQNDQSVDGTNDDGSTESRPKPKRRPALMSEGDLVTLEPYDVVCGRGAPVNFHPGNDQFRDLCANYQSAYFCAKRSDKPHIAMKVLDILQEEYGARFVRRQRGNKANSKGRGSLWVVVSPKLAYEKVCEGLRKRDEAPGGGGSFQSSSSSFVSPKKPLLSSESKDVHMNEIET
mmetsp:Transcript_53239/g.129312  ORF Transcript_53239/g.129312 Transcript_53239/m.129312 type:complete len:908 (-) Transcript_53239:161-2884(-)